MSAFSATLDGDRDQEKALLKFMRNTLLSESFYVPLQGVEIVIRNAFHKQLLHTFGDKWFDVMEEKNLLNPDNSPVDPPALQKLKAAKEFLIARRKPVEASRVVAELSFGFWVAIASKSYSPTLWNPCLYRTFRGMKLGRWAVYERLDAIRLLRNRIAHHEPIYNRNLLEDFEQILETIRWICGATASWIEATSCFRQRWAP